MASSWTARLRFELQATGENLNQWGYRLNAALARVDFAIAGWTPIVLTGDYAITSSNGDDQARAAVLKFTGIGATVTIPPLEKVYKIWNASSGNVTLTTGAGATSTVAAGEVTSIVCDGSNVKVDGFNGLSMVAYAQSLAFASVNLPAQAGNAGKFVTTNGTNAFWDFPTTASISDWAAAREELIGISAALGG